MTSLDLPRETGELLVEEAGEGMDAHQIEEEVEATGAEVTEAGEIEGMIEAEEIEAVTEVRETGAVEVGVEDRLLNTNEGVEVGPLPSRKMQTNIKVGKEVVSKRVAPNSLLRSNNRPKSSMTRGKDTSISLFLPRMNVMTSALPLTTIARTRNLGMKIEDKIVIGREEEIDGNALLIVIGDADTILILYIALIMKTRL
eukprot:CAMPEP_0201282198 /NCGR_PEP_ID=MMETSP1317-20130820/5040_1 /ASSEMBLY_ACC=CAM_ASM_000770 /TAXON_ID=187299 /ORGANISM="Undescribed Undescribed, Strain Undescribed" /LENGTH=198 /DNA_ID=CAMNT_0047594209 /DNA_START=77 /DNA_END=673 /DNA_ORIENTATION=+